MNSSRDEGQKQERFVKKFKGTKGFSGTPDLLLFVCQTAVALPSFQSARDYLGKLSYWQ
jgi:hypothetical protein